MAAVQDGFVAKRSCRLLVLSPQVPDVKRGSGSQDMYWFSRHAADIGYEVLFIPMNPKVGDQVGRWDLRLAGVRVVGGELDSKRLESALPATLARADIVAVFDKALAVKVRQLLDEAKADHPLLLFIPLDLKQFPQRVLVERNMAAELMTFGLHVPSANYVAELAAAEFDAIRASDMTALISTAELDELATTDFADRLVHLPMLRPDLRNVGTTSDSPRLVFVGGFGHPPNYLAVGWFLEHVWPLVRQRHTEVDFEIYGADLHPEFAQRWGMVEGVVIRGPYEREHEPYVGDVIAVAPLRYGGGTKGKVVGALGHGAVVVGTKFAAEGLPRDMRQAIIVNDFAVDMADRLVELLADASLRQQLRTVGRHAYERAFSTSAGREHVLRMLTELESRLDRWGPWQSGLSQPESDPQ